MRQLVEAARRWAKQDPDPLTRRRTLDLVDADDPTLIELFSHRLAFGTAGLRAPVGPGPNRMNALVVRQTTVGLMQWLARSGVIAARVLIGFDARHDSASFARHVAAAVISQGGRAALTDDVLATPIVAHATIGHGFDAAVVITASHNPAADNGYKLYLGDGLQLVAPHDIEIADLIDRAAATWEEHAPVVNDAWADGATIAASEISASELTAAHRDAAVAACLTSHRSVRLAYTAMHGVGTNAVVGALTQAGFNAPMLVESQCTPDPTFPTVAFPNPEEAGALDELKIVAERHNVDVGLANDPDADRLAMVVANRAGDSWTALSGNQLGAVLADHVLRHTEGAQRVVARSVVSSRLLDKMAAACAVRLVVTLTGFKWVARPIVSEIGADYVFGFEEAIGYCIGTHVRDKDGITAALIAAELISELKACNTTIWDRLDQLALAHGVHATSAVSLRLDDLAIAGAVVAQLTSEPPASLGSEPVVSSGPIGGGRLPATPGVQLLTDRDTQVIIRPSGTEPKLKAYVEVIEPVDHEPVDHARKRAADRLDTLTSAVRELLNVG